MTKTTPSELIEAMRMYPTGVTIVTTVDGSGAPCGLTANSFTSVSLDPPLVLVCLSRDLSMLQVFLEGERFAVSILGEHQQALSRHFATPGSDRTQAEYAFSPASGLPLLSGSLATLECRRETSYPGGDHIIMVGRVERAMVGPEASGQRPLLFFAGRYGWP